MVHFLCNRESRILWWIDLSDKQAPTSCVLSHPPVCELRLRQFDKWWEERKKTPILQKTPKQTKTLKQTKKRPNNKNPPPSTTSISQQYKWCKGNDLPPPVSWLMPSQSLSDSYQEKALPAPVFLQNMAL